MDKIGFKQLSLPLKILVVFGWLMALFWGGMLLSGFFYALFSSA